MQDYYEILQVSRDASINDITKSYKRLALQCHPDVIPRILRKENLHVSEEIIKQAIHDGTENFKKLSHAYSILSDPEKKARYDNGGKEGLSNVNWPPCDTESFFINLPVGAHYNKQSFDDMLTKIHHKLDQILSKSSTDYRYQKIKKVITDLKKELVAAVPKNNNHLSLPKTHEYDIIPAIQVYQFLLDAQIAIQRAKTTGVPETHRGLLLGTPVLRELTILGLAIMRFTVFVTFKIARCIQHDNSPVFQNGMYLGLFKPPKTQTAYYLDAFEKALEDNQEMVDLYIGLCENGKIYNYLSFYPKDEYHVEEFLHYSI